MQNFLTHILSGYSLPILTNIIVSKIIQFMKWGAGKKLHLRPIALQCMALKYQHYTQHTHNEAPCRHIEENCHFFSKHLFNKIDVLIMKITLNCKE